MAWRPEKEPVKTLQQDSNWIVQLKPEKCVTLVVILKSTYTHFKNTPNFPSQSLLSSPHVLNPHLLKPQNPKKPNPKLHFLSIFYTRIFTFIKNVFSFSCLFVFFSLKYRFTRRNLFCFFSFSMQFSIMKTQKGRKRSLLNSYTREVD
jgi:hypothetical protein